MTTLAELMVKVGVDADDLESGAKSAADDVEKRFDAAGREVAQSFDKAEQGAKASFSGIEADARQAGAKIESAGDAAGDGFSDGMESSLSGLGSKLSGFGEDTLGDLKGEFALGGAAAGVALVAGLGEAMAREAGTDKLAAQLGLSPKESEEAGKVAGELYGAAYGDSLEEVNAAVGAVMSTLETQSEKATSQAATDALNLAATFDTDVVDAVSLVGFTMEKGLADSADQAFDLVTAAMQRMPAGMREELFPIIEEYGRFLTEMGFTGEDAFGLIVSASEGGTFALDKTLDAIKEFTIRATDMSTASVEAFDAIGLDAEDMAAKILAGGDTAKGAFDTIVDGILAIEDPVEQANTAIALFGTPLEDMAVSEIPDFLEGLQGIEGGMGDVSTAAEDMDQTLNDNAQVRFEEMKRTIMGLAVEAIDRFLLPAFDRITRWAQDNPAIFRLVIVGIGLLALAFTALGIAAGIATIGLIGVTLPLFLIALAVLLVIGLIILLIVFWDEVKTAAGDAWDFIKTKAGQAVDFMKEKWNSFFDWLKGVWNGATAPPRRTFGIIRDLATGAVRWIKDRFNDVVSFVRGLPGRIRSAASGMWDGIKDAFKAAINTLIDLWNGIVFPSLTIGGWDPLGDFGPSVPEVTIGGWDLPHMPRLAEGGIATGPTVGMFGEGRFDEAIVPLPHGMRTLAGLRDLEGGGGGDTIVNVAGSVLSERELIEIVRDDANRGGLRGAFR